MWDTAFGGFHAVLREPCVEVIALASIAVALCNTTWHPGDADATGIYLGGGFKHFLFSPLFGEDFQFD